MTEKIPTYQSTFLKNTLQQYTPEAVHSFFGRKGGVSAGAFGYLNASYSTKDLKENVTENRNKIARQLNINQDRLVTANQIHSSKTIIVTENNYHYQHSADALVTNVKNIAISVLTADCAPILLIDYKNNVIAATHAGWRGAFSGVINNTILAMQELGANPKTTISAIGPCISQKNYEVDEDFMNSFIQKNSKYEIFFIKSPNPHKFNFNLSAFNASILNEYGIETEILDLCTYELSEDFFSHRRALHNGDLGCGRQISTIIL